MCRHCREPLQVETYFGPALITGQDSVVHCSVMVPYSILIWLKKSTAACAWSQIYDHTESVCVREEKTHCLRQSIRWGPPPLVVGQPALNYHFLMLPLHATITYNYTYTHVGTIHSQSGWFLTFIISCWRLPSGIFFRCLTVLVLALPLIEYRGNY